MVFHHKSEMAGPFNRGDTVINEHFTFTLLYGDIQEIEIIGEGSEWKHIPPSHRCSNL